MPTSSGPFIVNEDRARVIDFSYNVYIDDLLGIIPFKVEKDAAVIIRPFGWRVWLAVLGITPLYLLAAGLADLAITGSSILPQKRVSFLRALLTVVNYIRCREDFICFSAFSLH